MDDHVASGDLVVSRVLLDPVEKLEISSHVLIDHESDIERVVSDLIPSFKILIAPKRLVDWSQTDGWKSPSYAKVLNVCKFRAVDCDAEPVRVEKILVFSYSHDATIYSVYASD